MAGHEAKGRQMIRVQRAVIHLVHDAMAILEILASLLMAKVIFGF